MAANPAPRKRAYRSSSVDRFSLVRGGGINNDRQSLLAWCACHFLNSHRRDSWTKGFLPSTDRQGVVACFRQRFKLWFPVALNNAGLPDRYEKEHVVSEEISQLVYEFTGVTLPQSEVNNLVVLLRAAFIRNRSYRFDHVIVICPSGMATAQLLVARLHARFPNLSNLEVVSLRDLTQSLVSSADLILTTVPLPRQYANNQKVIQVHPLLMPKDIDTITQFLS